MKMRSLDGATRSALLYSDDLRVYADRLRALASAQQQGGGEVCPHCKGNPGLDCNSFGRTAAPPSAHDDVNRLARELDVALNGDGFFAIQTPAGERWSKSGAFQLNAGGTLVDTSGNPVLGQRGPITFGPEETGILIGKDGAVSSSAGPKGTLRLVEFDNPQALTREGSNLYAGGTPTTATDTRVMQGFIEKSNVSGVTAMAEMIRVQRAYESAASLASKQDDLRRSAIQRLGDANA